MHESDNNNGRAGIEALINADAVTVPTREVLNQRLARSKTIEPLFFDSELFKILTAVCNQLVPQEDEMRKVDIAGILDENLFQKKGKGWRYDSMPPDGIAFANGLRLVGETAQKQENRPFYELSADVQCGILRDMNEKKDETPAQKDDRFFQELLAAVVEIYYSHPYAKASIGDRSFADAHGWQI